MAAALILGTTALADASCPDASQISTCVDADTLWPAFGPARLVSLPAPSVTPPHEFALGLVTTYLSNPIKIRMASAAPTPVETSAVGDLLDMTITGSFGIAPRLEAGLAFPFTAYRTGTGVSSVASQQTTALASQGLRDLRLGAAYAILDDAPISDAVHAQMAGRLELSLPTGDAASFGTNAGFAAVPAIVAALSIGRFWMQSLVGARLRKTADLLGTRIGSQLWLGLGGIVRLDEADRFRIGAEAFTLPTLTAQYASQGGTIPGASRREEGPAGTTLVPTEWMLSVHAAPFRLPENLWFALGVGGPIQFGGSHATMPNYRFVLSVRYTPTSENTGS